MTHLSLLLFFWPFLSFFHSLIYGKLVRFGAPNPCFVLGKNKARQMSRKPQMPPHQHVSSLTYGSFLLARGALPRARQ